MSSNEHVRYDVVTVNESPAPAPTEQWQAAVGKSRWMLAAWRSRVTSSNDQPLVEKSYPANETYPFGVTISSATGQQARITVPAEDGGKQLYELDGATGEAHMQQLDASGSVLPTEVQDALTTHDQISRLLFDYYRLESQAGPAAGSPG